MSWETFENKISNVSFAILIIFFIITHNNATINKNNAIEY